MLTERDLGEQEIDLQVHIGVKVRVIAEQLFTDEQAALEVSAAAEISGPPDEYKRFVVGNAKPFVTPPVESV